MWAEMAGASVERLVWGGWVNVEKGLLAGTVGVGGSGESTG